ncbi:MAG: aldose 1-epimerase family protein [Clostridiales Family XIII bacterium]|jgi:hypothetical protein|nr:aldose 1-epimerase family protein [Clostridiales Family XIII bacterium]
MDFEKLHERLANIEQVARITPYEVTGGRGAGMRACDVVNGGGLTFTVREDMCLDIARLSYKGVNLSYLTGAGLLAPQFLNVPDSDEVNLFKTWPGGMVYTLGLQNVGVPCEDEGIRHPFHGNIAHTAAESLCRSFERAGPAAAAGGAGQPCLRVAGEMHETYLYAESLTLRREITTPVGGKSVSIRDEVRNEGFGSAGIMFGYHINFGYPLLDAGTAFVIPSTGATPRDAYSESRLSDWPAMGAPDAAAQVQSMYHNARSAEDGRTAFAVVNDALGLGLAVRYNKRRLCNLLQLKLEAPGNYLAFIEPLNCLVEGRADERRRGTLQTLEPGARMEFGITLEVLEGAEEIEAFRAEACALG